MSAIAKAIAGAVTSFGGALGTAAADGIITGGEWYTIIAATLVAAAAVWYVPNKPVEIASTGKHAAPDTNE